MVCLLYGAFYMLFAIAMIVYGSRVMIIIATKKNLSTAPLNSLEDVEYKRFQCKILTLTTVLSLSFLIRSLYNFLYAFNIIEAFFSNNENYLISTGIFLMILEFLPMVITLLLFFKNMRSNVFASYTTASDSNEEEEDEEGADYGSFNPNLRKRLIGEDIRKTLY